MATVLSPSALAVSASNNTAAKSLKPPPQTPALLSLNNKSPVISKLSAAACAGLILLSSPLPSVAAESYKTYYGTAASAANYGGYGGNSSKKDSAEYVYDVPEGWKERLVSKVEKGTNGTDSEFYNPRKKSEKEYLTFLSGFRQLAPREAILNNLALSDVNLLDSIANADSVTSLDRIDDSGQLYYDYEISGASSHSLISVTCANNKLYAHFVNAPAPDWTRDQDMLRHIHYSFTTTLGSSSSSSS